MRRPPPIAHFAADAPALQARARMGSLQSLRFAFVTTNIREDSSANAARDSRARVEGTTLATSGAARRPRLPHEPLLELGLDRGAGEVGIDVGITLLPQGLADLLDAGRGRRDLEGAFDDVRAVHNGPEKKIPLPL